MNRGGEEKEESVERRDWAELRQAVEARRRVFKAEMKSETRACGPSEREFLISLSFDLNAERRVDRRTLDVNNRTALRSHVSALNKALF